MSTKIEKTDKADAKADALVSISSADLQLLKDAALERDQLRVELQASATSLESLRSERAKLQESLSKGGNETLDDHSLLQREIETLKDQVQRATDDAMRYAEEAKRADAKLRELTQGKASLETAFAAVSVPCTLEQLAQAVDAAAGQKVWKALLEKFRAEPALSQREALLKKLGVSRAKGQVVFSPAPLAAAREALTGR